MFVETQDIVRRLGAVGDARADAVNAQAGANTAALLLQMEQFLMEEPLMSRADAVAGRKLLQDKMATEYSWQSGAAWGAGMRESLGSSMKYLRESFLPQDISQAQSEKEIGELNAKIAALKARLNGPIAATKASIQQLRQRFYDTFVGLEAPQPGYDWRFDVHNLVAFSNVTGSLVIAPDYSVRYTFYDLRSMGLADTDAWERAQGNPQYLPLLIARTQSDIASYDVLTNKLNDLQLQYAEIAVLTHKITLYPGQKIEQIVGGYGISHPTFTHPGGNPDFINGAAGANTAAMLLMLHQYLAMEPLLAGPEQIKTRDLIKKDLREEISWQHNAAWGAGAFQSLEAELAALNVLPYPKTVPSGGGTGLPELGKAVVALARNQPRANYQADLFALSDIIPFTKGDFSKILKAMQTSDWYVTGVTRIFTHEQYVEMLAAAWSNPYYAQEWLRETDKELQIIGFHPGSCADILSILKSGRPTAINYQGAWKACITPPKKKGLFGGMGGIIGIILAVAIAVVTAGTGAVAALAAMIALQTGISVTLATAIAAATIAAASSAGIQAVTTGTVNPLGVAIAAAGAGLMVGAGSFISDAFSAPPTNIVSQVPGTDLVSSLTPPVSVPTGILDIPTDLTTTIPSAPIGIPTADLSAAAQIGTQTPWYNMYNVDIPGMGTLNPVRQVAETVVGKGVSLAQQRATYGRAPTSLFDWGVTFASSIGAPIAGRLFYSGVDSLTNPGVSSVTGTSIADTFNSQVPLTPATGAVQAGPPTWADSIYSPKGAPMLAYDFDLGPGLVSSDRYMDTSWRNDIFPPSTSGYLPDITSYPSINPVLADTYETQYAAYVSRGVYDAARAEADSLGVRVDTVLANKGLVPLTPANSLDFGRGVVQQSYGPATAGDWASTYNFGVAPAQSGVASPAWASMGTQLANALIGIGARLFSPTPSMPRPGQPGYAPPRPGQPGYIPVGQPGYATPPGYIDLPVIGTVSTMTALLLAGGGVAAYMYWPK